MKKWNPLWFVLDDTIKVNGEIATDYAIYLSGFKYKWIGVLSWHILRNRVWNFVQLFKVKNGNPEVGNQDIIIIKLIKDNLHFSDGTKVKQNGPYMASAALKYVGTPGQDPWQVNRGDVISSKHSIIGEGEIEYLTADGFKGWRRTSCKLVRPWYLLGLKRWRTIFFGTNTERYAFKFKHQKDKPWGE